MPWVIGDGELVEAKAFSEAMLLAAPAFLGPLVQVGQQLAFGRSTMDLHDIRTCMRLHTYKHMNSAALLGERMHPIHIYIRFFG